MPIAKGSKVKQVVPAIEGEVGARRFDESSSEMEYHVDYKDAAGHPMARWFKESELTVTAEPQPEAPAPAAPKAKK